MRVLLLCAPSCVPRTDAIVRRSNAAAAAGLRAGGHSAREIDLHSFSPVLTSDERLAYLTDEPIIDSVVADYAEAVLTCDALVLVYATTLSTLPPVLKGWLDRVLVPGVSFTLDKSGSTKGGLTGIRRIVGISVYEGSWWATKRSFDNGRRILCRNLRLCTGWWTRTAWLPLYGAADSDQIRIDRFMGRIERRMAKL